jgi:3',5'-nucleoside bisphosphate phosphatase
MIDLHTHSDASDGELSPGDLVSLASENGVTAIALTDHDTMAGLAKAKTRAQELGMRFISGVETEVDFAPGEFHLLGYGMKDFETGPLADFLEEIRKRRNFRNEEMISLMNADGLQLTLDTLADLSGGEVIGRLHFARWLIDEGIAKNVPDAFERWLGPRKPYHVPKLRPQPEEALAAIKASGGKPVLAHPLSLWISWGKLAIRLKEWKAMGLEGLEARHSGASRREAERLEELAASTGLFVTGGSDFHGTGRPDRKLGYGAAGAPLDEILLEPFDEAK